MSEDFPYTISDSGCALVCKFCHDGVLCSSRPEFKNKVFSCRCGRVKARNGSFLGKLPGESKWKY